MSTQSEKRGLAFVAGAAFLYFGVVGISFFALGLAAMAVRWQPESQWAFQIFVPLLLCAIAALVLAAVFRVVLRDSGMVFEQAKRLWSRGCAVGFVMWWNLLVLLMPIRFPKDISGDSTLSMTSLWLLVAGAILMYYSKPESPRDQQGDRRPVGNTSR